MSPNLLATHSCIHLISEAHLLRKLKNLCCRAAASLSYKYPPSGYVVGLIGCWACSRQAEQFGAEPCMKPLYCLELPVLPERRGQLLFTRSHTYTVYALVCSIVSSSLCVCGFHTFLSNGSKKDTGVILLILYHSAL